tara:strand:- start:2200 stop:2349 length:150 start_codon:yes stop_codon:yes gene_type:complete
MSYLAPRRDIEKWLLRRTNFTKTKVKTMSLRQIRWFWYNPDKTKPHATG